jgi:NADH-quinone oxidoreductase subunit H
VLSITGNFSADLVIAALLKFGIFVFGFVMVVATLLTWLERKYSALMQNRIGPNRANFGKYKFGGLLHIVADAIKMLIKEDFVPNTPNPIMFRLAPLLAFVPALAVFVAVPFGPRVDIGNGVMDLQVAPTNLGILVVFALSSLNVYGAVLGAWASNNKWSLMGGLRITAQMISYEVALGLSLVGIFMIYGSLDLYGIVEAQSRLEWGFLPAWGIVFQPFAFVLYLTCAIAENKRAPFDVAEAESELTAGYWTEYSAMAFGVLAIAEFVEVVLIGCLGTLLFLGGWDIPGVVFSGPFGAVLGVGVFTVKVLALVWLQMTIRWTLPRFRYDQIMKLGWTMLLPAALVNILLTGVVLTLIDRF